MNDPMLDDLGEPAPVVPRPLVVSERHRRNPRVQHALDVAVDVAIGVILGAALVAVGYVISWGWPT